MTLWGWQGCIYYSATIQTIIFLIQPNEMAIFFLKLLIMRTYFQYYVGIYNDQKVVDVQKCGVRFLFLEIEHLLMNISLWGGNRVCFNGIIYTNISVFVTFVTGFDCHNGIQNRRLKVNETTNVQQCSYCAGRKYASEVVYKIKFLSCRRFLIMRWPL